MDKIKILIANGHLRVGGCEKSLINLLNAIDYSKSDVDLLLFEGYGEYKKLIPKEVNIIMCDITNTYGSVISVMKTAIKKRDIKSIIMKIIFTLATKIDMKYIGIMKIFRITQREYDFAFAYRVGIAADFIAYAINAKEKSVWWHNGQIDNSMRQIQCLKKMMKEMNHIVCVSEAAKKIIFPYFKEFESKIVVISNIIDFNEIREKAILYCPYENIKENCIKIVSVGRFSPEKHMADTVWILKQLIDKGYNIKWYLVGDGVEYLNIESKIKELNLEKFMVLVGSKSNPYPYIAGADIFVHPSYVESQGMTVLEAMALHKICVIVKSAGTDEFVIDGKNAIQAQQTIESVVEKLEYAIKNKKSLDFKYQEDLVVAKFSKEKIMKQIFNLGEKE